MEHIHSTDGGESFVALYRLEKVDQVENLKSVGNSRSDRHQTSDATVRRYVRKR